MTSPSSPWMDQELLLFRDAVARFVRTEMEPNDKRWREQKHVDRALWTRAGANGFLCTDIPAEYGGAGADFRYEAVFYEEQWRRGLSGLGQSVHSICAHYILNHGSEAQKRRLLPLMAKGELIGAIGMTEPGAGSDLQAVRTRAIRDGDDYVVNGSKIFITNGYHTDLIALVVRTGQDEGAKGISILLVETRDLPGYSAGRKLHKIGQHAQDTCELYFDDVRVPSHNLLGEKEGQGFTQLMTDLPYERTIIALLGVATIEGALQETLAYCRERKAFGKALFELQNTRFKLAEVATQARIARMFIDDCIQRVVAGTLDTATASMAKWWITDQQQKIVDECLQLHGGYGYMDEYLIGRMFVDSRVQSIYGGTNEIMKEVIARSL